MITTRAVSRSLRRASAYAAGVAKRRVNITAPTLMITLLTTALCNAGLLMTTSMYDSSTGGKGTNIGGVAKISLADFSEVAKLRSRSSRPVGPNGVLRARKRTLLRSSGPGRRIYSDCPGSDLLLPFPGTAQIPGPFKATSNDR